MTSAFEKYCTTARDSRLCEMLDGELTQSDRSFAYGVLMSHMPRCCAKHLCESLTNDVLTQLADDSAAKTNLRRAAAAELLSRREGSE